MAQDRYRTRRNRLLAAMKQAEIDAVLVAHPPNVRYLTGFTGEDSQLLFGPKHTVLLSDSRFTTQIAQECPGLETEIRTAKTLMPDFVAQTLVARKLKRVGFESAYVSVASHQVLTSKAEQVELVPVSGLVETLRQVKDKDEVAAIRRAIHLAQRGLAAVQALAIPEMTEREVAHELEHAMRRFGALRAAFETIVGVGPQSALPHYRAGELPLNGAGFVLLDWGAVEPGGYHSDLTRVWATSKIPPKLDKLHRVVSEARAAAIELMRPGVSCQTVDAAARKVIADAGFEKFFGHGLGHGIGLEIHEGPRLSPISKDTLEAGMIVTVEPGIYLPGFGGVRLEDDVLITEAAPEVLSNVPLGMSLT
ncbi:MAG TPA: Xaa-Pro peptidase family protein [Planctomycetaceae bacterium]|nr:Xaa-Pro peptidase family protein [Planctomycetaceae bacterium]